MIHTRTNDPYNDKVLQDQFEHSFKDLTAFVVSSVKDIRQEIEKMAECQNALRAAPGAQPEVPPAAPPTSNIPAPTTTGPPTNGAPAPTPTTTAGHRTTSTTGTAPPAAAQKIVNTTDTSQSPASQTAMTGSATTLTPPVASKVDPLPPTTTPATTTAQQAPAKPPPATTGQNHPQRRKMCTMGTNCITEGCQAHPAWQLEFFKSGSVLGMKHCHQRKKHDVSACPFVHATSDFPMPDPEKLRLLVGEKLSLRIRSEAAVQNWLTAWELQHQDDTFYVRVCQFPNRLSRALRAGCVFGPNCLFGDCPLYHPGWMKALFRGEDIYAKDCTNPACKDPYTCHFRHDAAAFRVHTTNNLRHPLKRAIKRVSADGSQKSMAEKYWLSTLGPADLIQLVSDPTHLVHMLESFEQPTSPYKPPSKHAAQKGEGHTAHRSEDEVSEARRSRTSSSPRGSHSGSEVLVGSEGSTHGSTSTPKRRQRPKHANHSNRGSSKASTSSSTAQLPAASPTHEHETTKSTRTELQPHPQPPPPVLPVRPQPMIYDTSDSSQAPNKSDAGHSRTHSPAVFAESSAVRASSGSVSSSAWQHSSVRDAFVPIAWSPDKTSPGPPKVEQQQRTKPDEQPGPTPPSAGGEMTCIRCPTPQAEVQNDPPPNQGTGPSQRPQTPPPPSVPKDPAPIPPRDTFLKVPELVCEDSPADYQLTAPSCCVHPVGKNTCYVAATLELIRLLPKILNGKIRAALTTHISDPEAIMWAAAKYGADGEMEDVHECLGKVLTEPWAQGRSYHVVDRYCLRGHHHSQVFDRENEQELPLAEGWGVPIIPPAMVTQSGIEQYLETEESVPIDDHTPECKDCKLHANVLRQRTILDDVLYIQVQRRSQTQYLKAPCYPPACLALNGRQYALGVVVTCTGQDNSAHFVPHRLYKDRWYELDDMSRVARAEKFKDIDPTHIYIVGYRALPEETPRYPARSRTSTRYLSYDAKGSPCENSSTPHTCRPDTIKHLPIHGAGPIPLALQPNPQVCTHTQKTPAQKSALCWRLSRRHTTEVIRLELTRSGIHPNPGPGATFFETIEKSPWAEAAPAPPFSRNDAIAFLEGMGFRWLSGSLSYNTATGKKVFKRYKDEAHQHNPNSNGIFIECLGSGVSVIDIDGDSPTARSLIQLVAGRCNLVARTRKGVHLFYQHAPELGHGWSNAEAKVDVRSSGGGKTDIVFVAPSRYDTEEGPFRYSWLVIPAIGTALLPCPRDVVDFVSTLRPGTAGRNQYNNDDTPGKYTIVMNAMGPTACPVPHCNPRYSTRVQEELRKHIHRRHGATCSVYLPHSRPGLEASRSQSLNAPNVPPQQTTNPVGPTAARIAARVVPSAEDAVPTARPPTSTLKLPPPEVNDWPRFYRESSSRRALRRVAFAQQELWRDICGTICAPYDTADPERRQQIYWEFLTAVKRFLYLPNERLAKRALHKRFRLRAAGVFDEAQSPQRGPRKDPVAERNARAERFIKEGALGKAARTMDSKVLPPLPDDVQKDLMRRLHPRGPAPTELPPCPDKRPRYADLDEIQLSKSVRRLPKAAAPGPSGWTRELLLPIMDVPQCLPVLKAILLGVLNDDLPLDLRSVLPSSLLVLLTKDTETGDPPAGRPISMGELFCKLAACIGLQRSTGKLKEIFGDLQLGALHTQGAERIILESRRLFRSNRQLVMVTLDLRNAFNTLCRRRMMEAVHNYGLFDLYNLVHFLYDSPSRLLTELVADLTSSQGVRQGDPLGPILFALGIHDIIQNLARKYPKVTIRAYLDDITIVGEPADVAALVEDAETLFRSVGLEINRGKSKVSTHTDSQFALFTHLGLMHAPGGQKVLGACVASTDAQESKWVLSRAPRMKSFFENILSLDRQCVYALFRYCGLPRWTHIVRCHTPEVTLPANEFVDDWARSCVGVLLGCGTTTMSRLFGNPLFTVDLLAGVPFTELAPAAYQACHDGASGIAEAPSQHELTTALLQKIRASALADDVTPLSKVHTSYLLDTTSRLWLECLPNRGEYIMRRTDYEIALRTRYLLPPNNEELLTCMCGRQCPHHQFVVHALDCNKVCGYTWASRHALVKRVFKQVLRQYGFRPDDGEPRFFGNGTGPDVCFLLRDKQVLVDVVITNPLADTYIAGEASEPGFAVRLAESTKDKQYSARAATLGMEFYPLALSTFGTLGPRSLTLLRHISKYTVDRRGFLSHMGMALSVAVQTGNARIVMAAMAKWWQFGVR